MAPLILTLLLDERSFERLDAMRRALFPPALNRVPAHLTLFHHLPGEEESRVMSDLAAACGAAEPMAVRLAGPMPLGRGVAIRAEAPAAAALREGLARKWERWLTPQDRQPWRPHVTVQNKVTPALARDTLARLGVGFAPWDATATGLALWRYLGGPWEAAATIPFGPG